MPQCIIDSDATGEMDYEDFARKLAKNKGTPAIVSMNAGTTVTGAVDNLSRIKTALYENGFSRDNACVPDNAPPPHPGGSCALAIPHRRPGM